MFFSNPKFLILNYYDSLVNQIDIYTEEELDRTASDDRLDFNRTIPNESILKTNFEQNKPDYFMKNYENEIETQFTDYSYEEISDHEIIHSEPTISSDDLSVRDYLNSVRQTMLLELSSSQIENLKHYEKCKSDLNKDFGQEKVREHVFESRFCFIIQFDHVLIGNENQQSNYVDNPSPFKLYLFLVDFYMTTKELELLRLV